MAQAKALFLVEVAPYKSSKRELHTVLKDGRCTGEVDDDYKPKTYGTCCAVGFLTTGSRQ